MLVPQARMEGVVWALPCPLQSRCSGFPELTEVEPDFLVVDKLEEKMSESRGKKSRPAVRGEAQRPWAAPGGGAWQGLEGLRSLHTAVRRPHTSESHPGVRP